MEWFESYCGPTISTGGSGLCLPRIKILRRQRPSSCVRASEGKLITVLTINHFFLVFFFVTVRCKIFLAEIFIEEFYMRFKCNYFCKSGYLCSIGTIIMAFDFSSVLATANVNDKYL